MGGGGGLRIERQHGVPRRRRARHRAPELLVRQLFVAVGVERAEVARPRVAHGQPVRLEHVGELRGARVRGIGMGLGIRLGVGFGMSRTCLRAQRRVERVERVVSCSNRDMHCTVALNLSLQ